MFVRSAGGSKNNTFAGCAPTAGEAADRGKQGTRSASASRIHASGETRPLTSQPEETLPKGGGLAAGASGVGAVCDARRRRSCIAVGK
jgi:hypothetical protein